MEARYVDHMGDDLRVVNAARVSFAKESDWENEWWEDTEAHPKKLSEKDEKLINYLAKHGHWTPFAHPMITIVEKVPIFVARQRFKHMVGFTYNEVSRRYVDDKPEFYIPNEWRSRPEGSVKQGSGSSFEHQEDCHGLIEEVHFVSKRAYDWMIKNGVAPEQARMVLPQSMYTEYYVTGSLAAWARAYKQRSDPHAQMEIQELAKMWDAIIRPLFPVSWKALTQ